MILDWLDYLLALWLGLWRAWEELLSWSKAIAAHSS